MVLEEYSAHALVLFAGLAIVAVIGIVKAIVAREPKSECIFKVDAVPDSYDYQLVKPAKYRPMKPVYHMVMNISKVAPDDWLHIDSDYDWVTKKHTAILNNEPDLTCKANTSLQTLRAVQELYELVFGVLLQRYPRYFSAKGSAIVNHIRGNIELPRYPSRTKLSAEQLLRILMENTEEDFQVLQYDPQDDEYVIRGIGGLTSDGFLWKNKLDKKLTDVHAPVPNYKEKLKMSMNRFFSKLQPGSIIQRFTWGIHLGAGDTKFHPNKKYVGSGPSDSVTESDFDFEKSAWLRVERQVPTKLPKTGFLILTQHTYWYPLTELKMEGIGDMTATSIEAWPKAFADYKGRDEWGEAVCAWLRKE